MKKKAIKVFTGLMCAALIFSNTAGMRVYAMEDGAGQETQMHESVSENDDTGEIQEEPGGTEQEQAGGGTEPEEPAEPEEGEDDEQENGDTEDGGEILPEDGEEDPEETGPAPEGSTGEEPEKEAAGTVSENTVEAVPEEETVTAGMSFSLQAYSAGEFFTVDGKAYNSLDADETFSAGDDITAYYFEADSLLYFDGTGLMPYWSGPVTRPWNEIEPAVCVVGEGITSVGTNTFYWVNHSPRSVLLPDTLRTIEDRAFYQCAGLETISLPNGLEKIGKEAFLGCHALTSIDIPGRVTEIGETAFYECRAAASIHVPGSVKEIPKFAFAYCEKAADIQIDEGVETIGDTAFQSCGGSEVILPGSIKSIGERAFGHMKNLYRVTIPDSVTQIGPYAFTWCNSLFEITVGTGVTSIGEKAFAFEKEMKFRLHSENEVVWDYDWTGDRRVVAYRITFKNFDDAWSMTNLYGMGAGTDGSIYTGGGRMIHAGDPISYADIESRYWTVHFYGGGRLP